MNEIHLMEIPPLSKIDLNLLVVLDVLLREQSVSRTADRLHLTSSAVSHALKRLRTLFDNELLVRDGRRMVPTARGQSLAEILPVLMMQLEDTLAPPEPFDPVTSTRNFRLAMPDFFASLVPQLLKVIAAQAPNVRVEMATFVPTTVLDMAQGRYDALIAPSFKQTDDLRGTVIGVWPWTVYGRKDHPAFLDWSIENWVRFPHLQIGTSSSKHPNPFDRISRKQGLSRKIGAIVPQFSMAAPILADTDLLLTVPSIAMMDTARVYELDQRSVPFDFAPFEFMLFRSATTGDQPETRWFLECILNVVNELAD